MTISHLRAAACAFALAAAPAGAAITDLTIHGFGSVTYSVSDPSIGFLVGPAVGTPVEVTAYIHLGTAGGDGQYPAAPSNNFTGTYELTQDMVFDGYSSFSWYIDPADSASSSDTANEYTAGSVDFVSGKLTGFSLVHVGDPDGHSLSTGSWSFDFGSDSPAQWGGTWAIDRVTSNVPEPASWTLLIAGFGLVGGAMRRGVAAARAAS